MIDLCIENCKITEKNTCCINIENGKIIKLSKLPMNAEEKIDAGNKLVLPGLIDVHVHFRDPGLEYKEDFKTGSYSAANGGFTTVFDMPNTIPKTNTAKNFKDKKIIVSKKSIVDYGLHAGVNDLNELNKISKLNPGSFKIFMDLVSSEFLVSSFKKISELDVPITLHAEDHTLVNYFTDKMKDKVCAEVYSYARPSLAEEIAVNRALALAQHYNNKLHFCHITSKKSLDIIKSFKDSVNVSSEITPHHLFLSNEIYKTKDNYAKTNPPLRSVSEKLGFDDLKDIDMIGTDHAPHTLEEKNKGVWESLPGIPNLETVLKLLLTEFNKNNISLSVIKRLLCESPAERFNLKNKGFIKENMDADLIIIDLDKSGKIDPSNFYTKAKYTPFENRKYKGDVIKTILRGKVIMDDNQIIKNKGKYVYN